MKPFIQTCLLVAIALNSSLVIPPHSLHLIPYGKGYPLKKAYALPPAEDVPEEVMRTEIILEGRSPVDGKPLSARDYEELTTELSQSSNNPKINSDIEELIFLLQLRKLVKTIIPFY